MCITKVLSWLLLFGQKQCNCFAKAMRSALVVSCIGLFLVTQGCLTSTLPDFPSPQMTPRPSQALKARTFCSGTNAWSCQGLFFPGLVLLLLCTPQPDRGRTPTEPGKDKLQHVVQLQGRNIATLLSMRSHTGRFGAHPLLSSPPPGPTTPPVE